MDGGLIQFDHAKPQALARNDGALDPAVGAGGDHTSV